MPRPQVELALLWHMHQPLYREPGSGAYVLPWVRLHSTRAYNDMACMLERHPEVRCTVNFTPVLLEQLEDYARGRARDELGDLSARPPADLSEAERQRVLHGFFMVDWGRSVRPVARYWELLEKRGRDLARVDLARVARTFDDGEIQDLQALFNLAWMGFAALDEDAGLAELARKGRDYTRDDVDRVLAAQRRILAGLADRWRALAAGGRVELSTTPYHHPILPLVCDSDAAARALPGLPLPPRFAWEEDARWQVREALASHERRLGRPAAGMWPAEGSVSPEALQVLASEGVRWAASDEDVLLRSLPPGRDRAASLYRPWRVATGAGEVAMLFRDRSISDLVGFTYASVPAEEAAAHFVDRVRAAGEAWQRSGSGAPATVGVFLDGENPWERFPRSGHDFLEALYRRLGATAGLRTVTLSEATGDAPGPALPSIHSGSWIEASFRIWIGHREDRLAWTALGRAREAVEAARRAGAPAPDVARALSHLHAAEGSDWYWWYGEDFSTENAAEFDALFRGHVVRACEIVGAAPPAEALTPIKPVGRGALEAKALREPTQLVRPVIDGRDPTWFEWQGAGRYRPAQDQGAMAGLVHGFAELHWGFDERHLYLRLDPVPLPEGGAEPPPPAIVHVLLLGARGPMRLEYDIPADGSVRPGRLQGREVGTAAFLKVAEIAVPIADLDLRAGDELALAVEAGRSAAEVARLPRSGYLSLTVPGEDFERIHWRV